MLTIGAKGPFKYKRGAGGLIYTCSSSGYIFLLARVLLAANFNVDFFYRGDNNNIIYRWIDK